MRVLHLFSNSKWTGPAEPALNLCISLRQLGIATAFACAPYAKSGANKIVATARARGIEPILRFHLKKRRHLWFNLLDRRTLQQFLSRESFDIVHCHLENDHRIAFDPARKEAIPIIRSNYDGLGLGASQKHLLKNTAWLIEPSDAALDHDARVHKFPRDRMCVVPGAIDTNRFDPDRSLPDVRPALGIAPDSFVVGMVARMQPHRRYEDFWQALRMLRDAGANIHAVVVGRGTRQESVAMTPVRELKLDDRVHFPEYVDGDDYVATLKAFDALVYLVPGSDGTCRTVREALAMGVPAVVADRGMLREIVQDGETGYVCDGSAEALRDCLSRLSGDPELCKTLGRSAREIAFERYSLRAQAEAVAAIYEMVLGPGAGGS